MKAALLLMALVSCLCAQQPKIENARLETRSFSGSLTDQLSHAGIGPFWAAWSEPIIPGRGGDMCQHSLDVPVRLEGETALVVLTRIENAQIDQLRIASPDCRFDAGGLPFFWFTGVPESESVNWLKAQVPGKHRDSAIFAIGLHSSPAADQALEALAAADQPETIREKTAFWLGHERGAHGVEILKRMLAEDPSQRVREQVVFALAQTKEPSGLAAVLEAAKTDKDARVRSRALFWLAQKATDKQTRNVISNAVLSDPERSVKVQAVFALKQLPEAEGVPLLVDVARNNPDPEVRRKAIFWLGQSTDRRALDFFAQILKP